MDRRTVRTRQLLRDALVTLMLEKEYDSITVQDITDQANLGRATFYLHFQDKEDLLYSTLEELYDELTERIERHVPMQSTEDPPPIQLVLEHAVENQDLYRVVLNSAGKTTVFARTRDYIAKQMRHYLALLAPNAQIPLDVIAAYLSGAQMSLISWWLEEGMPYSVEEMVIFYRRITVRGIAMVMGLDVMSTEQEALNELEDTLAGAKPMPSTVSTGRQSG